jgi:hypothetical protein
MLLTFIQSNIILFFSFLIMENNKYERSEYNNYSFPLLHPRELLPNLKRLLSSPRCKAFLNTILHQKVNLDLP